MNNDIRILYVDDSPLDRDLVKDALERESSGFLVTEAGSREELEYRISEEGFDLLITDFNILGFDGLQVIDLVRSQTPDMPVIILTGTGSEAIAVEAMRRGVDDYVIKTRDHIRRLPQTIRSILEKKRIQHEHREAVEALRQGQERLDMALETGALGLWDWNLNTNEVFYDKRWSAMLGYAPDEIELHLSAWERLAHPDDKTKVLQLVEDHTRGKAERIHVEHRLKTKSGEWKWILATAKLVERNADGSPARILGTHMDISERKRSEQLLKDSERRYRLLAENTLDVIWQMDLDLRFTYVNPAIISVTGHTVDEWIGTRLPEHCDEENFMIMAQVISDELAKGIEAAGVVFEATMLTKDKEPVNVEIHGKVLFNEYGLPEGLQGVTRNVSDRKKAEKALRESEQTLKTIMEANPVGISLARNRELVWANRRFFELFGYKREDEILERDSTFLYANQKDFLEVGRMYSKAKDGGVHEYECLWKRADGSSFEGRLSIKAIDQSDPIKGTICAISDITERKLFEQRLMESEQRYRAVVDNLQVGISVLNPKMEIVAINPFFHKYYPHVQPGEGQICHKVYIEPSREEPCNYCPCVSSFEDGLVNETETEMLTKEGLRSFRIISCPVKDTAGRVELVVELIEDVTESRSLQSQLVQAQKMEAIGTLAGGVAHDFNNILQVVLGYSELIISDERIPDSLREDLGKVVHSARTGAELVQRLLTFSRKTEFKFLNINLNTRIEQLQKMLYRILPKMIDIEVVLDNHISQIKADPTQIEQIILNLAINARDAMPSGGRLVIETEEVTLDEVYCNTHAEARAGRHVLLTISDTGSGMDKETLERMFEPFFTTKKAGEGTGLGLAMVYGIVKQHGGHIMCYSEISKGTTFRIYFPALHEKQALIKKSEQSIFKGGSETILLVDDEDLIRDLGARILTKAGYQIITAANGLEALDAYREHQEQISLVILDVIMPEMGGAQCLQELIKINPDLKILIASGFSINSAAKEIIESGAKGFLRKPFNITEMLKVVRKVLDER